MKLIKIILVSLPLYLLSSSLSSSNSNAGTLPMQVSTPTPVLPIKVPNTTKSHYHFLTAIGHMESGNRYDVVNKWGYMGRYQFGKSTLRTLGYKVTRKEFLSNHSLQEEAMNSLLKHNQISLQYYITTYEGKQIWGVNITKSGLLAAAHLAGSGNVKKFFHKGLDFADANGTKMTSYIKKFGGYKLNI